MRESTLKFKEKLSGDLPVQTFFPSKNAELLSIESVVEMF